MHQGLRYLLMTAVAGAVRRCEQCGEPYANKPYRSAREFAKRRFCGSACSARHAQRERFAQPAGPAWEPWMARARCAGTDVEMVPDARDDGAGARGVCSGCPVLSECRRFGVTWRRSGVYGGVLLVQGVAKRPAVRLPDC